MGGNRIPLVIAIVSQGLLALQALAAQGLPSVKSPDPPPASVYVTGAPYEYQLPPMPSTARTMAERALSGLRDLANHLEKNREEARRIDVEINSKFGAIRALEIEKEKALSDLRTGMFCSLCHTTKTQMERAGKNFYDHVRDVGGKVVSASQEEIAAAAAEYDRQIAAARAAYEESRQRGERRKSDIQREQVAGETQVREGIALWDAATRMEEKLLSTHESAAQARDKEQVEGAQRALAEIDARERALRRQNRLDSNTAGALDTDRRMWGRILSDIQSRAELRFAMYLDAVRVARETRTREYSALSDQVKRAIGYEAPLSTFASSLPSLSASAAGWTAYTSPDAVGARFAFGKIVTGSVEARTGSESEVRTFLSLFGRLQVGVGWQTQYTPDGVVSRPSFNFGVSAPRKTALPEIEEARETGRRKPDLPRP